MVNNNLVEIHNNVSIGSEKVNSVNARDLYSKLQVKSDFKNWVKNRLEDTMAEENTDFITFEVDASSSGKFLPSEELELNDTKSSNINNSNEILGISNKSSKNANLIHKKKEYFLTIDLAKEICMLERNDIGKQIRKYFIECEKKLKEQPQFKLPQTYKEALLELVAEVEKNEQLTIENKELKEINTEQNKMLTSYSLTEKSRRSKQQLWNDFVDNVKRYSIMYNNSNFSGTYNVVYSEFAKMHQFNYKVNKDLIMKNIDYICECNSIILSLLGEKCGV